MVVVPYRPTRRVIFLGFAVLLIVGGTIGGYKSGHVIGASQSGAGQINQEQLVTELADLVDENSTLRSQVALLDRSSVMDQQTSDEVQGTILGLRERIAQLEQDVLFYRQVMSEDLENVGLVVGQIDIGATEIPDRFSYKLVMRQEESSGDTYLSGLVNVTLTGALDGEQVELPLREISRDEDQLDIKLRFKYFQNIEGELELPDGFVPEQIRIKAVATAPMAKTIDKSFSWIVEGD